MENPIEELKGWRDIISAFDKLSGRSEILTHFKTSLGNGFTTTTDMTTQQLIECYGNMIGKPKSAAQILSITFALTLHCL
jgi:hypothetical protein